MKPPQNPKHKKPERRPPGPVTASYLENAALYYLERFSASSERLRQVLRRKVMKRCRLRGEEDAAQYDALIDALITRYTEAGLLNDARYAEAQAASLRRRGASARGVAAKLMSKGIGKALISATLAADETEEIDAARTFARRKKLGPWRKEKQEEMRERDMAALARAGFSYDVVRAVMESECEEV